MVSKNSAGENKNNRLKIKDLYDKIIRQDHTRDTDPGKHGKDNAYSTDLQGFHARNIPKPAAESYFSPSFLSRSFTKDVRNTNPLVAPQLRKRPP